MRALFEQARKPGRHQSDGDVLGRAGRRDAGGAARPLSRRAAGARRQARRARRHAARSRAASATARGSSRCRSPTPPKATASRSSGRGARSPTPRSRARCARLTPEEADKRILALALEHHLVTRLTSLVAVDKTPSRPDGARLTRADLPLNLPAGWDFDKVFGTERAGRPDGAASTRAAPRSAQRTRTADLTARRVAARSPQSALPRAGAAAGQAACRCRRPRPMRSCACGSGSCCCAVSVILLLHRRRRVAREPARDDVFTVPSSLVEEGPGGGLSSTPAAQRGRAPRRLAPFRRAHARRISCLAVLSAPCSSARASGSTPRRCWRRCCSSAPSRRR